MSGKADSVACGYSDDDVLAFVDADAGRNGGIGGVSPEMAEHLGVCPECREAAVELWTLEEALAECAAEAVRWHRFPTPFGPMYVAATDRGLTRVSWKQPGDGAFAEELQESFPGRPVVRDPDPLARAERELREYFAGERERFDLAVDLGRLTPFQQQVLQAVRRLGHGQVVPYAELARRIGRPEAYRAVGNALGENPVAVVVPCHRVIRSDGSLGGYGSGLEYKERLLRLEGRSDLLMAG